MRIFLLDMIHAQTPNCSGRNGCGSRQGAAAWVPVGFWGGRGNRGLAGGRGRVEARRDAGLTSPLVGHGWPLCCARAGRSSAQGANTRKGEQAHGCAVTWRRKTVMSGAVVARLMSYA